MQDEFRNWMIQNDRMAEYIAYQYALSIDRISEHYYEQTGEPIDIYKETNLEKLRKISFEYGLNGKFADFGDFGNGIIRNAIDSYIRFLQSKVEAQELKDYKSSKVKVQELKGYDSSAVKIQKVKSYEPSKVDTREIKSFKSGKFENQILNDYNEKAIEEKIDSKNSFEKYIASDNSNDSYEKEIQLSLIHKVNELFPCYNIFGKNKEGINYEIEGNIICMLLENPIENSLLAIEVNAGKADYKAFGKTSMYLGLLSKKFPNKIIRGLIIAEEIDDSLKNASLITDKIKLKTYKMKLSLENII